MEHFVASIVGSNPITAVFLLYSENGLVYRDVA